VVKAPSPTIMKHKTLNCQIGSLMMTNMIKAEAKTVKLATKVKPFLREMSLSLLYVLKVIELTTAILDI